MESVNAWEEKVVITTYGTGEPDKNPMFFEKRVYQGSSGVVYPHPVVDKISDEKKDKEYTALFLENKYLKIMILPELGGRVQMAYDKIKGRHFIYYNRVIKPALVGLCGPWISGGIEFNWPQHHRPSTFEPVDYSIEENPDGSKTVWVNEIERMFRTRATAGFTLHPDKAYLEINVKLYNRTSLPQTFLWWANPAVKVNDHYQSVFPPDVHAVFDHGKRDVSSFPIATGTYYKVDYSPGTDISWYKNIPVPTSYMAIRSGYDFMGGYEHDTQAGVLHIADHHVSPGKKQWTWGHSDFGQAWDRNLTDEDGPYIELMTGVFTDNQPDFSWLMPYEEKSFTQYFLPYRELGLVKNATKDLLVNVNKEGNDLVIKVFATSIQKDLGLQLLNGKEILRKENFSVAPETVYTLQLPVPEDVSEENIVLIITGANGIECLRYEPQKEHGHELPQPAKAALQPQQIENNEQLYLTGLHLEQYRHATFSPVPYYEEALRRDPGDVRSNNALGLWYFRRGQFALSEPYFRKAIETLTSRNANPYDGEPFYNLGLCLQQQGKDKEAYDAFYKATWNSAWQGSAFFSLAQIDVQEQQYAKALEHSTQSLKSNAGNAKACALKVTILRKTGQHQKALMASIDALEKDRFNLAVYFEQYKIYQVLNDSEATLTSLIHLKKLAGGRIHNYIEYALDYAAAHLYQEAIEWLLWCVDKDEAKVYPMVWYYLGWLHHRTGHIKDALMYFEKGSKAAPDHCFPNRLEDIAVLQLATSLHSTDAKAPYYLGNLWYDKRQYKEAIEQWELSVQRDDSFPTVFRNLGMASYNKKNNPQQALTYYELAFALDTTDARVLMELDQLYKRLNKDPEDRLHCLEEYIDVVESRDDLYLERVALYNYLEEHEKAYQLIMRRQFHPWEGGEGKVSAQYVYSLVEMAKKNIHSGDFKKAIELLKQAQVYPPNLGEGKLFGAQESDIFYWMGVACEGLELKQTANEYFRKATMGLSEPAAALFYNDQQPDKIFYQALAWQKLGEGEKAYRICFRLVEYGKTHMNDEVMLDYFAVSLPDLLIFEDDLKKRHRVHCNYIMGLGYIDLQQSEDAIACFSKVLDEDAMHFGARTHLVLALEMIMHSGNW